MSRGSELAYPLVYKDHQDGQWIHEGMTIREAFAMAAMQGMATELDYQKLAEMSGGIRGGSVVAKAAVVLADALIDALKETP